MVGATFPILLLMFAAAAIAGAHDLLSALLGPRLRTRAKLGTYESGMPLLDASRKRMSIQFFVVAMVFILFDVEIAFLYPWALVFRDGGLAALRRDGRLPRRARGRLRLHLEEGGLRLVSHRRYSSRRRASPVVFPPEARERIEKILERYPTKQAALLPVLWVAQETWGWISREAAEEVGRILELPPAHVDGVLTFYTMYNLRPAGQHLLQICTSISCHLAGAGDLVARCRKRLGIDLEETTPDGRFTLVEVECIAGCDRAPSMMVNDTYHEPMDEKALDALLDGLAGGERA